MCVCEFFYRVKYSNQNDPSFWLSLVSLFLHWQFSARLAGYIYVIWIVDKDLGQCEKECITAAAYSALPPALLVMWVVAAEV